MTEHPTEPDVPSDDAVFECLADYSRRLDAGESVAAEQYRGRLGGAYPRFVELLEMEGTLRHAVEPHAPDVELPRASPARYSDFRAVGEGGMGLVFKATDTTLNRTVAFKVIKPTGARAEHADTTDPMSLETPGADSPSSFTFDALKKRFFQEAWVTSGLTHPGIIPIYELGETPQGIPYYTMRFVEGERTLAVAIGKAARGGLEERLALLEPFLKVCDTVRYAHARGVVHRDLKPQNVAIGTFGEVIVLDWGLAKLGGHEDPHAELWTERVHQYREATDLRTMTSALGTPGYMAPEAAIGDVQAVDAQSDVYSLGVILFELLTGRLPFTFQSFVELAQRLQTETAPRVDALDPEIPAALADLCARALARAPGERPADVGALADGVRAWQVRQAAEREEARLLDEARAMLAAAEGLSGAALLEQVDRASAPLEQVLTKAPAHEDATALRAELARQRERGIRERGASARRRLLTVAGGVALLVVAVLGLVFSELLREERDQATARLWQSYRDQARAGRSSGRMGQRLEALTALEEAVAIRRDVTLRDDVLACLPLVDLKHRATWSHDGASNTWLAVDGAFERYARATPDGAIELCDLGSGTRHHRLPSPGGPVKWTLRFDPTGRTLLAKHHDNGPLTVWDAASGEPVRRTKLRFYRDAFDFHPDGDRVACANRKGMIEIRRWPSEEVLATVDARLEPYSLRFSPDGSRVAVTSLKNRWLVVADLNGGPIKRFLHTTGSPRRLAWSPDGRYIATAVSDGTVLIWRLDGTSPLYRVLRGHQAEATEVAFTADGSHLVSVAWDDSVRIWDHEAGALRLTLPVEAGNIHLRPDDKRLVLDAQQQVHVYDLVLPDVWMRLPLMTRMGKGDISFDSSGERLAVAEHYAVQIWDPAARTVRATLPGRRWSTYFLGPRLVVSGPDGVFQHDVRDTEAGTAIEATDWRPPMDFHDKSQKSGVSADGRFMAVAMPEANQVVVFPLDESRWPRVFEHPGATRAHLTPEGALLVTGAWRGNEIRVWDVATGKRRHTVPATNLGQGQFTSDGRLLITSDEERIAVHDVATWTQLAEYAERPALYEPALAPGGDLLAALDNAGALVLLRPATLEVIARIPSPDGGGPRALAWSPDGARLAVARRGNLGTEIWDVARMRARLQALGLDWD